MKADNRLIEEALDKLLPSRQLESMIDLVNRMDATSIEWKNIIAIPQEKMLAFDTDKVLVCSNVSELLNHVAVVCTFSLHMIHLILCSYSVIFLSLVKIKWWIGHEHGFDKCKVWYYRQE